ncbi:MAG: PDZ domain-containing protein [FCB group bacterium]|jgi:serine protease Do|nr:PDZ domain-containing protein [FCB group bacterium]
MRRLTSLHCPLLLALALLATPAFAQETAATAPPAEQIVLPSGAPQTLQDTVENAVAKVKPALVRIQVVSTDYEQGREVKYEAAGSGVIITPEGHIVTNHHVAGHAKRLFITMANKEELEATLVGTDALTDIAVVKLPDGRTYPTAPFGDSSLVQVGDRVLAMGSPMALSQSVTLGIVSNTELIMPRMFGPMARMTLDGEDVGAFVRWIGHDAAIYGGNSGGPLVNLGGEIIGINEISMSLGGAIPSNVASVVAQEIIKAGKIRRAWLGMEIQSRLKRSTVDRGVLVSGAVKNSPAAQAGVQSGDYLVRIAGQDIDVKFDEQLPEFNRLVAGLAIGQPVEAVLVRDGQEVTVSITPAERSEMSPPQQEFTQWGITARNITLPIAQEMKRETTNGVLVTSVRPGGPTGDAKPNIQSQDVIVKVNDTPINNMDDLRKVTDTITAGKKEPTPALVTFDRKEGSQITVVRVGIKEIDDPGREVRKAWIPIDTQVLTREIAEQMGKPELTGFRIIEVYPDDAATQAGLQVGDIITAVDGERLTATQPEDYEELPTLIRQYKTGTLAELTVLRGEQEVKLPITLPQEPIPQREMKKYNNKEFEFTVRNITFFDKAKEKWSLEQQGVLVEEVTPGGWANIGELYVGDLILDVAGAPVADVEAMEAKMDELAAAKPDSVVIKIRRGIHTLYLELQPKWENGQA